MEIIKPSDVPSTSDDTSKTTPQVPDPISAEPDEPPGAYADLIEDVLRHESMAAVDLARVVGVSPAAVSQWRSGKKKPGRQFERVVLMLETEESPTSGVLYLRAERLLHDDAKLRREINSSALAAAARSLLDAERPRVRIAERGIDELVTAATDGEAAFERLIELVGRDPYGSPRRSRELRNAYQICSAGSASGLDAFLAARSGSWELAYLAPRLLTEAANYQARRRVLTASMAALLNCEADSICRMDGGAGHLENVTAFVYLARAAAETSSEGLFLEAFERASESSGIKYCWRHSALVAEASMRVAGDVECAHIAPKLVRILCSKMGFSSSADSSATGRLDDEEALALMAHLADAVRLPDVAETIRAVTERIWDRKSPRVDLRLLASVLTDDVEKAIARVPPRGLVFLAIAGRAVLRQAAFAEATSDGVDEQTFKQAAGSLLMSLAGSSREDINSVAALICLEGVVESGLVDPQAAAREVLLELSDPSAHIALAAMIWCSGPLREVSWLNSGAPMAIDSGRVLHLLQVWLAGIDLYSTRRGKESALPITPPWLHYVHEEF